MQAKSDAQLLREYTAEKSESAFGEVVQRHTDLVYSAALRQVGSPDLAGEIAQRVFIDLVRKARSLAGSLREDASLAGWLYRATRYTTLNLLREERRRHTRERQVMQELHSAAETPPDWDSVSPLLDKALSTLDEQERDALLLRFFKKQDFRTVGSALGVSDDTAQKRVARSLEKLRSALLRRGVTTTTAALSAALASHAVQAAPAGLSAALISASLAHATAQGGAALTLLKLMSMTKIQFGLSAIVVAGLATALTVQHQTERRLSGENQALQQEAARLAADSESLSNQLRQASASPQLADSQLRELVRLRSEVGRLRQATNLVGKLQTENRRLHSSVVETTGNQELEAAKFVGHGAAVVNAAKLMGLAFRIYADDHNHQYPTNFAQCSNELMNVNNLSKNVLWDSFEMVNVGKIGYQYPRTIAAREQAPRQSPLGNWERVYLLGDGSVQVAGSTDDNFEAWEQGNTESIPSPAQ